MTMSDFERACRWRAGPLGVGVSSSFIADFMCGLKQHGSYPHDPDDFGRCARLLTLYPEWRARLPEMASAGPAWAALVARWNDITEAMELEAGIDWHKRRNAKVTYALMRSILDPIERGDDQAAGVRVAAS